MSVSGQAIPAPSGVLPLRGDLLLRGDGTFAYGIVCTQCAAWSGGTYQTDGDDELRLTFGSSGAGTTSELIADRGGDSLTLHVPLFFEQTTVPYVFRRAPTPKPTVSSGLFVLTTLNGRGRPFTVLDTAIGTSRTVWTVPYDSITFTDDLFFIRRRADSSTFYIPGDSATGGQGFAARGVYETIGGKLFLRYFSARSPSRFGQRGPADSLAVSAGDLVGTTVLPSGAFEERYTKR